MISSAARPPEGARAPSGGSDPHEVGERGGSRLIPKVLVTKIGFDGHDRGSRVVTAGLRDAGMEVIYTPPWQEIAAVVKLALEEDVDVIGISSLATDHLIVPRLLEALREAGLADVGVIVGGIVPDGEEDALLAAGVARVFHPGSSMAEIAAFVRELAQQVRARRATA
jgi:methylmalonyl-CoA mutase, C-terminal domain